MLFPPYFISFLLFMSFGRKFEEVKSKQSILEATDDGR